MAQRVSSRLPAPAVAEQALASVLLSDRLRLRRKLRELRDAERNNRPFDRNLARWEADLAAAQAAWQARIDARPVVKYDDSLPIHACRAELLDAIQRHQVVVICGETGSGKSTQLPKLCLELGRGREGLIGHTQPRRIAARTIASRLAEELGVPLGREVGYQVRFTDATSPVTLIKLLTDGLLLAESTTDRLLARYDTLIIDEAHERSLNIDLLLGLLHRLLPKRPDLKVIITSATIDAQRFADHFATIAGTVPILTVEGRTYPVETVWWPNEQRALAGVGRAGGIADDERDPWDDLVDATVAACERGPGDVLLFLATEREIHEAMKRLRGRSWPGGAVELLPLYARLSVQEQQRVFATGGNRRIVLATNVAESSLTVPGIRYVVDTGLARISRYSPKSKLQRLPIEPIAQASADQRAGRCGRVGPGVCFRLYDRDEYAQRDRYTAPEILRSNLAAVVLQLEALGLGPIEQFPFLDPPKTEAIRDAYKTLFELGAVEERTGPQTAGERYQLTPLGRTLHRYPVDPRIARILVAAQQEHSLEDVLIIAAALEILDPRDRPLEKQQAADEAHSRYADPDSDFLSLLRLWDFYHKLKDELTRSQLKKACQQNFLSPVRMQEWSDIYRELRELMRDEGRDRRERKPNDKPAVGAKGPRSPLPDGPCDPVRSAGIHRALLTGFLSNIAYRTEAGEYLATGGWKANLWPGSHLVGKSTKWIVCAELVETTRRYLRTVSRIDPAWIEPLAGHLLTRTFSEPHWDPDAQSALAYEKVSLFGLPVVPKRRVRYGKIDAVVSRELMIREGLVLGLWTKPPEFLERNRALAQQLADLQARSRQPAALRDEEDLIAFYETRLPVDIVDGAGLQRWLTSGPRDRAEVRGLSMTEADLLAPSAEVASTTLFPSQLAVSGGTLPLSYKHDPGSEDDGVTLTIPQAGLNQLDAARLGWLVPGLLEEKVTALLRTLPKDLRRSLPSLPETARAIVTELEFGAGELPAAITRQLRKTYGVEVPITAFDDQRLPEHLRLRIAVVDPEGQAIAAERDLGALREQLGAAATALFAATPDPHWTKDGLTTWSCGPLPDSVRVERGGAVLIGTPTLIDRGNSVALRLLDSPIQAGYEFRFGLIRLFCLAAARELKQQVDHLPHLNAWTLLGQTLPQPFPLRQHLTERIAERAFLATAPWPRSQPDFGLRLAEGKRRLSVAAAEVVQQVLPLFEAYTLVRRTWERTNLPQYEATRRDVHDHLSTLLSSGFLIRTPWHWIQHLPRYLRGIARRLEKLSVGGAIKDQQLLPTLLPRWQRWKQRAAASIDRFDPELENYRWMLEEFRIWLFAQDLGTALSVSEKKIDKQWSLVVDPALATRVS